MNTLKKLTLVTTLAVLSTGAFASQGAQLSSGGYINRTSSTSLFTPAQESKQAAFDSAYQELQGLQASSTRDLRRALNIWVTTPREANSVRLKDNAYITVDERMNGQGEMEYVGKINVTYQYLERDDNN
ncbi:DUF3316 domain-containing protein [Vibrio sp. TRT 21S02]|uniref:DUF3316 domain-containing protein n=1 Tax=Vibrio sp. TRT 21S02 TaxID=3418507 RepID=UPI003CFBB5D7